MHIFVETLNGTTSFSLEPSCSVEDLKEMIETEESVSADAQRLSFAGKQLENDHTLAEYNIQEESVLSMTLRLIGGGKVHGSLTRAGKVKNQTPKVDKQEKGKSHVGRAKKREQYNRRYVNVVLAPGAKRVGPNNFAARQARAEAAAKRE